MHRIEWRSLSALVVTSQVCTIKIVSFVQLVYQFVSTSQVWEFRVRR